MKRIALILIAIALVNGVAKAQTSSAIKSAPGTDYPWTDSQLLEPSVLAADIKDGSKSKVIFNIGAVEDIKGARHIGAVSNAENLEKLRQEVAQLPKNTDIVIYCGCCPFTKCPNARPAFTELKKLGFTNVKLLNLTTNLKTNWIAKGYPLASK